MGLFLSVEALGVIEIVLRAVTFSPLMCLQVIDLMHPHLLLFFPQTISVLLDREYFRIVESDDVPVTEWLVLVADLVL